MDSTKTYDFYRETLERLITSPLDFRKEVDGETLALSNSFCTSLRVLREELVKVLEPENDAASRGESPNGISDETLRSYFKTSRAIRAFIFDNIDTHILTIERLADQTLAKRHAYERARKNSAASTSTVNTKAIVDKAPVNKATELAQDLAKLSKEDLANLLAALGGTKVP